MQYVRKLSFCLSVTFVYCTQTAEDIDTISFAYDSQIRSQITSKSKSTLASIDFATN